ncbi:unnamed protein product [Fusarium graminearum]|uniref:Uncharacterized protein n=1 Tax=Gibberella zeae TaxID=5518 RepID=A0A4E9E2J9_GIBZA|nr:unnamed protein product [Fusarium graminearum]
MTLSCRSVGLSRMSSIVPWGKAYYYPACHILISPRRMCLVDKVQCKVKDEGRNETDLHTWYRKMMAVVKPENSIRNIVVTFAYSKFFIRLMAKCPKANILGMPLDEEPLTNVPLNSSMKNAARYVGTDAHKLTTLALVGGFKILRSLSSPNIVAGVYSFVLFPKGTKTQVQYSIQRRLVTTVSYSGISLLLSAEDAIVVYRAKRLVISAVSPVIRQNVDLCISQETEHCEETKAGTQC